MNLSLLFHSDFFFSELFFQASIFTFLDFLTNNLSLLFFPAERGAVNRLARSGSSVMIIFTKFNRLSPFPETILKSDHINDLGSFVVQCACFDVCKGSVESGLVVLVNEGLVGLVEIVDES